MEGIGKREAGGEKENKRTKGREGGKEKKDEEKEAK